MSEEAATHFTLRDGRAWLLLDLHIPLPLLSPSRIRKNLFAGYGLERKINVTALSKPNTQINTMEERNRIIVYGRDKTLH